MTLLIKNIRQLLQVRPNAPLKLTASQMRELPILENAWLSIEADTISGFGTMETCPPDEDAVIIDASGKIVLPGWCDSHTHLVYAGNRVREFADRIHGLTYEEIANRGGGILNSAKRLQETSEDELYEQSRVRLEEVIRQGTVAIEIKSGYGLTVESELKMLRVIKRLSENYPVKIKATFLGAHAFPSEFKENHEGYICHIIDEMIPAIASENLADYIDAFCETGYFSVEETEKILEAGRKFGMIAKIHVNQFTAIGGIEMADRQKALTVDHLEIVSEEDLQILEKSDVMPVALPLCSFFISIPYTPARQMLDRNIPLALATDYNPGTAPSGNMNLAVATACIKMRMTPEEAINAATINAAFAMDASEDYGSITIGKKASVILTRPMVSYEEIPYSFGSDLIESVILKGRQLSQD